MSLGSVDIAPRRTTARIGALDGLRGLSIAAVVAYHVAPNGVFTGGFLGVSVFFTVSGFLITRNLLSESESKGQISVTKFWARRIRRLAPASFVVVAACCIAAAAGIQWISFHLGRDGILAILGLSNWQTLHDVRQFGVLASLGPFGAMWSLAVEEQFYFVVACLFWAFARCRVKVVWLAALFGAIWLWGISGSFIANDALAARYRTDLRASEIAVGALWAIFISQKPDLVSSIGRRRDMISLVCLVAAVAVFTTISSTTAGLWRGEIPLLALVWLGVIQGIGLVPEVDTLIGRVLSFGPLRWLGKISYSLYLVHWPVIVAFTPQRFHASTNVTRVVSIVVSVILAGVLQRFVEQPPQRWRVSDRHTYLAWAGGVATFVVVFGFARLVA